MPKKTIIGELRAQLKAAEREAESREQDDMDDPTTENAALAASADGYADGIRHCIAIIEKHRDRIMRDALKHPGVAEEALHIAEGGDVASEGEPVADMAQTIRDRAAVMPDGYSDDGSEITTAYAAMLAVLGFPKAQRQTSAALTA